MHWQVVFTDEARQEFNQLPAREQSAMIHALDKLAAEGPAYPHSSAVRSADRLREPRLRAGRSAWRALYRRVGEVFVVAAIGPEAQADKRGFGRAVSAAQTRLDLIEEEPDMKHSELTSADEVKAEALRNPAVRAEWDRTAVAREVASRVVRYRVEHGLSQAELGAKLGVSQPYVARLESGDQTPTLATLARLAQRLGLEFHIDVTPTNVRITA
ncbi:MAG: helix-turn-helix domain-containing protein [Actinomycetota bacterium]|nr:helix-turn-helix domain-containing protein [Actinomycetota bacterium]